MKKSVLKIALLIALCVLVCALVGCGKANKLIITNDETMGVIHTVENVKKAELGDVFAPAEEYEEGTVLNLAVVTNGNYFIDAVKVNGAEVEVNNNIFEVTVSGETKLDITYFDRASDPVLQERRDMAEKYMRSMMDTLFMYDKDYTYTLHFKPYTIKAGQLYRGLPYSNYTNNSLEGYTANTLYVDENGIHHMGGDPYSVARFEMTLGNNCCDMVYWAWSQFANSFTFRFVNETTYAKGAIKLGNYEMSRSTYVDTKLTCSENDYEVMFDAYSRILKGDAGMNYFNGGGHAIMFVENHTEYLDDGSIDADRSYVTYHDQNGAYKECTVTVGGEEVTALSSGLLDKKVSYSWLFTNGYLPVTCQELIDPSPIEDLVITDTIAASDLNFSNLLKGSISSNNYYMSHFTMTITDEAGNVVQKALRQGNEGNVNNTNFDMELFASQLQFSTDQTAPQYTEANTIRVKDLAPGKYHCVVTAFVPKDGELVVRDFDFTV